MREKAKGIMVYCQWKDGEIASVSRQLLGKGRNLADILKVPLMAAFVGGHVVDKAYRAAEFGADICYAIENPVLENYTSVHYAAAMEKIIRYGNPEILLIGATQEGRDIAARTAAKVETGLTADCTMLGIQEETGLLLQTRPAYGGRVTATILCPDKLPQMATVREGVFPTPEPFCKCDTQKTVNLSHLFEAEDLGIYVKSEKQILEKMDAAELKKAEIVVAGGRGMKNEKGMELVEKLAKALGGTAAASRGAVEDGLASTERQVGQTGHTIRPKLYIACGISGASQHMAGVQAADKILAINSDWNAPIMKMADYVLCADVFEAIPRLIELAEKGEEIL